MKKKKVFQKNNSRGFPLSNIIKTPVLATTYSSTTNVAVPSAMSGLTTVFEMGTGVPHSPELPRQELLNFQTIE